MSDGPRSTYTANGQIDVGPWWIMQGSYRIGAVFVWTNMNPVTERWFKVINPNGNGAFHEWPLHTDDLTTISFVKMRKGDVYNYDPNNPDKYDDYVYGSPANNYGPAAASPAVTYKVFTFERTAISEHDY